MGICDDFTARREKACTAHDGRILGNSGFVLSLWAYAEGESANALHPVAGRPSIGELCRRLAEATAVAVSELGTGSRRSPIVAARRDRSELAVRQCGYVGAKAARYLGVSTSCITRLVAQGEAPREVAGA